MTNKLAIKNLVLTFITFIGLLCFDLANVIGSEADLKMYRDSGIIGEKKTLQSEKVYHEPKTGSTFRFLNKGTFATPKVIDGVAYFDLNGDYKFKFECIDWKYSIMAHWSSPDVTIERVGFSVTLESPGKETIIELKNLDIPVSGSLSTPINQEQLDALQFKTYVEDPLIGDERILAAQQAIKWILNKGLDGYEVANGMPIKFTSEDIGNKLFIKAEIDIFSQKERILKKCVIWALNYRGSRLKRKENVRWMETWTCQLITNSSNYSSSVAKTYMILEALKFDDGRDVYPDLTK